MKEARSPSQVLFGYLPRQTVDLKGTVWKVKKWRDSKVEDVDDGALRQAILRAAAPWTLADRDHGLARKVFERRDVTVRSVSREGGVTVEPFPQVWMCKSCKRVKDRFGETCECGKQARGQLHFVGYCSECGAIREPYVPKCPAHRQVSVHFPGTSSAAEIAFKCPVCDRVLRKGFGFPRCECGKGRLTFNVHRAAAVFTPRSIVMVNSPSPVVKAQLQAAGGATRALTWVLDGCETRSALEQGLTADVLRTQLSAQGLSEPLIDQMVEHAARSGEIGSAPPLDLAISPAAREIAETDAVTMAVATAESRVRLVDLVDDSLDLSDRGALYRDEYPYALASVGLDGVDLIERFPVMTGAYGYTRGSGEPGKSALVPFVEPDGGLTVYGEVVETEALLFRLNPETILRWLIARGYALEEAHSGRDARLAILSEALPPDDLGDLSDGAGSDVLRLVHTLSHVVVRRIAALAGMDRNGLGELLVPSHAAFFVFAAGRGGFVLGGLQAVFERNLHTLLSQMSEADYRCPLDPGCNAGGGACVACMHLGEPSCRWYNQALSRSMLSGDSGYFAVATS